MVAGPVKAHAELGNAICGMNQVGMAIYKPRKHPLALSHANVPTRIAFWAVGHAAQGRNLAVHKFYISVAQNRQVVHLRTTECARFKAFWTPDHAGKMGIAYAHYAKVRFAYF